MKNAAAKQTKIVLIIATYVFKHINRVCFSVRSSNGVDIYQTCFDNGHATCTCPSKVECYHIKQLRSVADEKLAARDAKAHEQSVAAILAKHAATFNQDIVAFMQRAVAAKVEAQPASTSIGSVMSDADTAMRKFDVEAAAAGDRTYNDVIDAAYAARGAEIATKKIAYRIEARDGRYFPQHQYPGEAWDCYWTGRALLYFKSAYEARQHLATYYGAENVEVVGEATYCSCCGKLSKREVCYHCTTGR